MAGIVGRSDCRVERLDQIRVERSDCRVERSDCRVECAGIEKEENKWRLDS